MRVECRCLSGFSSSLIVGPGFELAWVPGGGVNCNDMQGQTDTQELQVDTTILLEYSASSRIDDKIF